MLDTWNDKSTTIRKGEELPMDNLQSYLQQFFANQSDLKVTKWLFQPDLFGTIGKDGICIAKTAHRGQYKIRPRYEARIRHFNGLKT